MEEQAPSQANVDLPIGATFKDASKRQEKKPLSIGALCDWALRTQPKPKRLKRKAYTDSMTHLNRYIPKTLKDARLRQTSEDPEQEPKPTQLQRRRI